MSNAFDRVNDSKNKPMRERIIELLVRNGKVLKENLDPAMDVDMMRALTYAHIKPFSVGDQSVLEAWRKIDIEEQNALLIEAFPED